MAKCTRCENESFQIEKRDDGIYCYVVCDKCNTVVGVLEDIDFNKHNTKVIRNHGFFEKRIKDLEEKLEKMDKRDKEMMDMMLHVVNKLDRNIK